MTALTRILAAIAFTALLGPSAGSAQTPLAVRVVTLASDGGAEAYYAAENGFFTHAGLDVTVTTMNSAVIAPAIASGTFDIAQSTVATLAAAREHGQPFVVIAPGQLYSIKTRPTAGIVVLKNSPIKTGSDMNGKIVAVSQLRGIAQVTVQAWVDKNGGESSTVKFIEMPPSVMLPALESGRVDVIELGEPELEQALARGDRSLGSGYDAVGNEFQLGAWYCTSAYAAAHPEVVRDFRRAMTETARWANAHQAESGEILAKWTKLQVPRTMPRVEYGERLIPAMMQPVIDVAAKYHALKAAIPATDMVVPESRK